MKGKILAFLLVCLMVSCAKEAPVQTTKVTPTKKNIQMVLTAKHVISTNPYADELQAGVYVELYRSQGDRKYHEHRLKYGTSDSLGRVTFEYLDAQDYFVEATFDGTDTTHIFVTYPSSALVSYEDLLMMDN